MNAMSVSPVKPPLNPGSHSVPTAATNLTKPSLPTSNNFAPINLIPEGKSVPPVTITASPEKSVDLCPKPPTSNGTLFPLPESNVSTTSICPLPSAQNCVENAEVAENLSTNSTPNSVVEPAQAEPKSATILEDKKQSDLVKVNQIVKEEAAPAEKEAAPLTDIAPKDVPNNVDDILPKEEDKELVVTPAEPVSNNVDVKPDRVEPIPENKKEEERPLEQEASATEPKTPVPAVEIAAADVDETSKNSTPKATKRKAKPAVESADEDAADGKKSKRVRLPTTPYQSPIPELQLIAKLNTPAKVTPKNAPERIIAFFKNEFLAVRNPEGSFYICQTFQNIHKSSTKIKIRWFTNLPQDVFTPDFYDTTEFDCILTNVSMTRIEKDRWKLPDHERTRIENILKRALDVEKGVVEQPSVTEEHPDGLDLSLFKDEAQLKKRKKKPASPKKKDPADAGSVEASLSTAAAAAPPSKRRSTTKGAKVTPKSQKKSSPKKKSVRRSTSAASRENSASAGDKAKNVDSKAKKDKKDKKKGKSGKSSKKTTSASKQSSSSSSADKVSSKSWEPSVKASNSSRVVLSLKKENAAKSSTTGSGSGSSAATSTNSNSAATANSGTSSATNEAKTTKRTSSVSLKAAGSASTATPPPPLKRRKEDAKPAAAAAAASTPASATTTTSVTPASSSTTTSSTAATTERTGKVRNAGSAVTAKINSAAMRTTKEKERKSTTPTSGTAVAASTTNQRKK